MNKKKMKHIAYVNNVNFLVKHANIMLKVA